MKTVTRAARDNGMHTYIWDNGHTGHNGFGLFDRSSSNQVHSVAIKEVASTQTFIEF